MGNLQLQEGSHYLGKELNAFVQYRMSDRWHWTLALGHFHPVNPVNGKQTENAGWMALQGLFVL